MIKAFNNIGGVELRIDRDADAIASIHIPDSCLAQVTYECLRRCYHQDLMTDELSQACADIADEPPRVVPGKKLGRVWGYVKWEEAVRLLKDAGHEVECHKNMLHVRKSPGSFPSRMTITGGKVSNRSLSRILKKGEG